MAEGVNGTPLPAPALHEVLLEEALARRWQHGIDRHRRGNPAAPFVGDAAVEAFKRVIDYINDLHEARQRAGLSPAFLAELERSARIIARRLQRQLLTHDHGGVCPRGHPALPPDPLVALRGGE